MNAADFPQYDESRALRRAVKSGLEPPFPANVPNEEDLVHGYYHIIQLGLSGQAVESGSIQVTSIPAEEYATFRNYGWDGIVILVDRSDPREVKYSVVITESELTEGLRTNSILNLIKKGNTRRKDDLGWIKPVDLFGRF